VTLILLPPSEGKTGRRRGRPFDPAGLSFPGLNPAREEVLEALAKVSGTEQAYDVLGVAASLAGEVAHNTRWRTAPATPVHELYSGVLYDALGYAGLAPGTKRRANSRLLVVSAAWGALRMTDRVPAYRLSMSTTLPGIGPLASYWKPRLDAELTVAAGNGLVVDCRSSTYAAAWRPADQRRWVAISVVREEQGRRTVVSHMAKHARGLVARQLLESGADPRTPQRLLALLADRWHAELAEPAGRSAPWTLTVVES
jgi:uncharacterized protein